MLPQMPWRIAAICAVAGGVVGAVVGFVRGLSYLPTLPVAIVEGAVLIGIPASILGLLLTGGASAAAALRHRITPPPTTRG
jgi:hypothetical protein